jgi:hypothetical protein
MDMKYLMLISIIFVAGCSDSGTSTSSNSDSDSSQSNTGVFIDSAVSGINYKTETKTGTTNASGEYLYISGESVTFSIGDIDLPTVTAGAVITPLDIFNTQDINNTSVVNMARLLQTLDADGNSANGILISDAAHLSATGLSLDFASLTFDNDVTNLVANSGSPNTVLIDETTAVSHLQDTLAEAGLITLVGSWYIDSANRTLITFTDESNYFVTQDVDNINEPLCSDGMESGTYTWDAASGSFSLINVIDTTGDCGLTSTQGNTYDATVTINGNTLTVEDSESAFQLSKLIDANNTIIGSWWYYAGGNKTLVSFIDNTNYFTTQDIDEAAEPLCSDGMESGTYYWDFENANLNHIKSFSLVSINDTTGDCGLTSVQGEAYGGTIIINNDVLTLTDIEGDVSFNAVK